METDARGNVTEYTVDPHTSRNKAVTDRCGNQTCYEYDENGRTAKVTGKDAEGNEQANVSYAYDSFDNLTEIVRGDGLKYVLGYNAFHNLESIGVDGKEESLVKYSYKNGNGRLKAVAYANGDTMKASYNSMGQMVAEKWYNAAEELTAHYQYTYDNQGNIVRSVDILGLKEYIYTYEAGNLTHGREYDITLDENGVVTAKTLFGNVHYTYDAQGRLTKKLIWFSDSGREFKYEYPEDGSTVQRFYNTRTSHSKTDSFGRKVFEEIQTGSGFISRQFAYHAGEVTQEHKDSDKLKSSATTNLVSQIILSDGRTLSYAYDAEERIIAVVETAEVNGEPVTTTTEYTYDAQGQLLTETVDGVVVNEMTYDGYGNILTKNGKTYTYGDSVWKDKLTGFDGKTITYDAQGNPTNYLGYELTWEKGRQLKSFGTNTYTYNANGIRTSKTVNGEKHTYFLEGTTILQERWGENTLEATLDNEGQLCGILFNKTTYFFLKNLQGDIIAICNGKGETVARYTYDAWGKCTIVEDTTDFGLATINPYRYRGYYYDTETGLYYLQSRYYDPVVGRFVNSDQIEFAVSNGVATKSNAFAYCLNNALNYTDANGTDAIWLQASKSVVGMGHTGLMFQYNNKWYYWYWGIHPKVAIVGYLATLACSLVNRRSLIGTLYRIASTTVLASCKLQEISSNRTLSEKEACSKANRVYDSKTKFDKSLYIKGNFKKSYYYFKVLNITRNYNLLRRNCMQTTVDGLYAGTFSKNNILNHLRLSVARAMIVPNFAYNYMDKFF